MAEIRVGIGVNAQIITGYSDETLAQMVTDFRVGVRAGRPGIFLGMEGVEADESVDREREGTSLIWVPVTWPVKFVFDSDELPAEVHNWLASSSSETSGAGTEPAGD